MVREINKEDLVIRKTKANKKMSSHATIGSNNKVLFRSEILSAIELILLKKQFFKMKYVTPPRHSS